MSKLVVIESPFAGDVIRNIEYAQACMADSIARGECPFASHLLYTQVLDDLNEADRQVGISIGLSWAMKADLTAVYMDLGESKGMLAGIAHAKEHGRLVVRRWLDGREEAL